MAFMNLYYRIILSGICTLVACFTGFQEVHAQRQPIITATPLVGDSVKAGKTLTVQDTIHFNGTLNAFVVQTKSLDNIVSLYINEFTNRVFPDTFHVTVRIQSNYTLANNSTGSRLDTLNLSYSKNNTYASKAIKFYKDYYSLQVQVLDVAITGAPDTSVRRLLVMENMMAIERYFLPNCTAISSVSSSDTSVTTAGELSVSWPAVAFIPNYNLEWTYIDKAALDAGNYNIGGVLSPQLIFRNNSTRITLSGNSYRIPMLYDGDGTLFFRVRTLQNAPDGEVIPGSWSTESGASGLGSYVYTGHQRNLNWQSTTTYTENGVRKSIMDYFDGNSKLRQIVTKDNTTQTTVVAETFYDKQGRSAIEVLPSPTLSRLIAYTPLFNVRNINSAEYDKSVYDTLVTGNEYCDALSDSMSVASGASQYYSPANPLAGVGVNQYIVDAKGFPFTEIRYTRDNTGRIDRRGGISRACRIGSGHEVRYFYASADQKELDALFGTEAGDASHYEKTMVRDENGQYTVTYTNMEGKTVATALAGDSSSAYFRVPEYDSVYQTDQLLNITNNVIKDNSIQAIKSILVPKRGSYTFHYSLSPESLSLADCNNTNICYDCLYDLTITINDNCSNLQFGGAPKTVVLRNFKLFKADSVTHNLDTTCLAAIAFDTSFSLLLNEGSYDISKVLSVSKEGMQYYRDSLFLPHNTCKSFNQFVLEQLDSLRQHLDCTPDSLTTNLTVAYREQMMSDLSPLGGQYADTASTRSCFSIFTIDGFGRYLFQTVSGYVDEEGNADLGSHFNGTDYVMVPPQFLTAEEFIEQFKPSWAAALLSLHPEYRLLVEYEKLRSAYTWEADFTNTETYADAVAKGYLNPTGSTSQPAVRFTVSGKTDSLFYALGISDPAIVNTARASINNSLFNYLLKQASPAQYFTLWGISTGIVKCNNSNDACYTTWNQNANVFSTDSLCTADLNMAWRLFRSQYLRIREDWIDTYTRQKAGIPANFIDTPCVAVFPDRDLTTGTAGQQYGGYNGTTQDITTAQNNLDSFLLANCKAYAVKWWQELAPCGYTQADSTEIINRLIAVAYAGADQNHPFGSSTVKPSSTNPDRSFDDVITKYNQVHYPTINPITCNAYLIPNPKPYNQPGIIVNLPIIAAPDSCTCSKISGLYAQFISDSSRYHTFSNYLLQVHHTKMSQGSLDTLRNMCTGTSNCKYLEKPILLPPALQCNVADVCVECNAVKARNDSFHIKFPGAVPTKIETDTTQQLINRIYANYMNAYFGFSKQAYEYLQFLETCSGQPSVNCDSTKWIVFNPGTNLLINADLYNNAVNNIPPYSQHFADGYFIGPPVSKGTHYVLVNKKDTLHAGVNTMIMQWRVKTGANSPMADPFIRRGSSTTYVGAEWIRDPADTTWWIGATILKAEDGDSLAGMGLESNSHGLLADWVKIINPANGDLRYFYDFTSAGICNSPGGPYLCGKQAEDSTIVLTMNPCVDSTKLAIQGATYFYEIYTQRLKGEFEKKYMNKCLNAGRLESFTVAHPLSEYHYTLYYYDQVGDLVKTVPPEGVHYIRRNSWLDSVSVARSQGQVLVPAHTMATTYRYNTLGEAISQHTPDAGLSHFWYDRLGRMVVIQNARQAAENNYSYTVFDAFARVTETGQKKQVTPMTDVIAGNQASLNTWLNYVYTLDGSTVKAEQVISTVYDVRDPELSVLPSTGYILKPSFQKASTLRNRVSYTRYYEKLTWNGTASLYSEYDNSITYGYDIDGNVDTLLQHYRTGLLALHGYNQFKTTTYLHDLISGKVTGVDYQPGMADQLFHRYEYDPENRITDVYVTDRKQLQGIPVLEEHDAQYSFYRHGPLARIVLGQQQVQGLDYAYVLQGWLKGVNGDSLLDVDGSQASIVAKDAYRFSLNYYNTDYTPIGPGVQGVFPRHTTYMGANIGEYRSLYNSNVSSMVVGIPKLGETRLYNLGYDQLNRLVKFDSWKGYNSATASWAGLQKTADYGEQIVYDGNGNIRSYLRNGNAGQVSMDNMTYQYPKDANGNILNNRLRYVHDQAPDGNYPDDIDNQTTLTLAQVLAERQPELVTDNYQYDALGNLIKDTKENIQNIDWNVFGKIRKMTKTDGTVIDYRYDVLGNMISKAVTKSGNTVTTWYVKDMQNNAMAIYTGTSSGTLTLSEHTLYGSERLGTWGRSIDMDAVQDLNSYTFIRGNKSYELTNQLHNVMVTVSDKKMGVDENGNLTVEYYVADVISATDMYPFGMAMPGRSFNGLKYRYGFNGIEKDNDCNCGEKYSTLFRQYDPRLGRWFSPDPYADDDPDISPYVNNENNPITNTDPNGDFILAIVKGLIDAGIEVAGQLASGKSWKQIDWTDVAISGIQGAASSFTPAGWLNTSQKARKVVKIVKQVIDKGGDIVKAAVDNGKLNSAKETLVNYTVAKTVDKAFKSKKASKLLKPLQDNVKKAIKTTANVTAQVAQKSKAVQTAVANKAKTSVVKAKVEQLKTLSAKQVQGAVNATNAQIKSEAAQLAPKYISTQVSEATQSAINDPNPMSLAGLQQNGEFKHIDNHNLFKGWVNGGGDRLFYDYEGNTWKFTVKIGWDDPKNIMLIKRKSP